MENIKKEIRKGYSKLENRQADIFLNSIENTKSEHINLIAAYMFICLSDGNKNNILESIEILKTLKGDVN